MRMTSPLRLLVATALFTLHGVHAQEPLPEMLLPVSERIEKALSIIPDPAATYDGGQVDAEEIRILMRPQLEKQFEQSIEPVPEKRIRAWAAGLVNSIVEQKLLLARARQDGFTPDEEAARKRLQGMRKRMGSQKFEELLKLQGVDYEEIVRRTADTLVVDRWLAERVTSIVTVKESEIRKAYKKGCKKEFRIATVYRASHVMIALTKGTDKEEAKRARMAADLALEEIRMGAKFERIARTMSDCPSSTHGGDLGEFSERQVPPRFLKVLKKMEPGQISEIIRTDMGLHIIYADKATPAYVRPFEAVRIELLARIKARKTKKAIREFTDDIRDDANAKVFISVE